MIIETEYLSKLTHHTYFDHWSSESKLGQKYKYIQFDFFTFTYGAENISTWICILDEIKCFIAQ